MPIQAGDVVTIRRRIPSCEVGWLEEMDSLAGSQVIVSRICEEAWFGTYFNIQGNPWNWPIECTYLEGEEIPKSTKEKRSGFGLFARSKL